MADLSHLSDDQLDQAIKAQAPSPDLSHMSDDQLDQAIQAASPPQPSEPFGHKVIREGLPFLGMVGGGAGAAALATPESAGALAIPAGMAGAGAGQAAGAEAASWLNHKIYGDKAPTYDSSDDALRVGENFGVGAATELGGKVLQKGIGAAAETPYIKPYLDKAGNLIVGGFDKLGQYVGDAGQKLTLKATGATGAQMSKFAPGTGKALVENVAPKFGEGQEAYAGRINDFVDQTGTKIGSIIKDLTDKGATASRGDLVSGIQSKIDELGTDPAQAQVVKQLEGIKADVAAGPETPNLSQVQKTKQGFQSMVNWANPEGNAAKSAAADVYKNAVIDNGAATDFRATKQLVDANKTFSQLKDVAVASGRRAATVNQSPVGGFLDSTAVAAGAMTGGPAIAVAAPIARRSLTSRLPSTMAASANGLSKVLQSTPGYFGKWTPVLMNAAARGETSLNASAYILQQQDPEFRQKMQDLNKTEVPPLGSAE